jgi:putative ABC transport system permease protein
MKMLLLYVRRSLRQHALSTIVTAASVALASGLLMGVFAIKDQARAAFTAGHTGYDAVLGARGSQLQLVLNSIFHLDTSPGNIPWKLYTEIRDTPGVTAAVPYAVGDNYRGFRIVGTTPEAFNAPVGRGFKLAAGGKWFNPDEKEAVVGSYVAQKTGLAAGSRFNPYHGLAYNPAMRHPDEYIVTGVLEPTNTPCDRVVWIPIDGMYRMAGHVLRGAGTEFIPQPGQSIPDEDKEVSAVMLRLASPEAGFMLNQMVNRQGNAATLAWPIGKVMEEVFDKFGWLDRVLALIAVMTALVSCACILAALYNTISERRREFAILRALGARKRAVLGAVLMESSAIAGVGAVCGYPVYAALLFAASLVIKAQTGVELNIFYWHPALLWTPAAMFFLGGLAGLVPALKAYATPVAENLAPLS